MGEYTSRVRYEDMYLVPSEKKFFYRKAQYVYSWRSRRSKYDLSDTTAGASLGVRTPRTTGSLVEILADRKRFAEELDSTMGGLNNTTFSGKTPYSRVDTGHNFISMKYASVREGLYTRTVGNTVMLKDVPLVAFDAAFTLPGMSNIPSFPTRTLPKDIDAPPKLEQQARLNGVFQSMNPVLPQAQIGETIVSLLRGEFPTLMKNIYKFMRNLNAKGAGKYAGGEYLNSVFGWQPLIRDFENAIKVLTAVDNLIYGKNFRRKRTLTWDSKIGVYKDPGIWWGSAYGTYHAGSSSIDGVGAELTLNSRFDIRLSARMGSIARPTIGANDYIKQAEEKLQQLGVWYPSLGWDLLPYSWLIDWFTNLGASLNNAMYYSGTNKLVNIDYAWATSCVRTFGEIQFARPTYKIGTEIRKVRGVPQSLSVTKVRTGATPFGFGLDLSGLNAGQVTILVALGLVKRP